jgi:hypothetical protein
MILNLSGVRGELYSPRIMVCILFSCNSIICERECESIVGFTLKNVKATFPRASSSKNGILKQVEARLSARSNYWEFSGWLYSWTYDPQQLPRQSLIPKSVKALSFDQFVAQVWEVRQNEDGWKASTYVRLVLEAVLSTAQYRSLTLSSACSARNTYWYCLCCEVSVTLMRHFSDKRNDRSTGRW